MPAPGGGAAGAVAIGTAALDPRALREGRSYWERSVPFSAFEDGLKMAWQHARQGVQCEDWQHERAGTEPLVCSRPPASLTGCACQADAQERPTQWKTSNTVKLARLTHS